MPSIFERVLAAYGSVTAFARRRGWTRHEVVDAFSPRKGLEKDERRARIVIETVREVHGDDGASGVLVGEMGKHIPPSWQHVAERQHQQLLEFREERKAMLRDMEAAAERIVELEREKRRLQALATSYERQLRRTLGYTDDETPPSACRVSLTA